MTNRIASSISSITNGFSKNAITAILVAVSIVLVGTVIMITKGAGFFTAVESDDGSLSSNAKLVTDSSASGGKAIQFTAPAPAPTPPPPTTPPPTPTPPPPSGGSCALPKYPTGSCTGVPSDVTLTNYTGSLVITTPGQVIDGKTINGTLDIRAHDVVIKNSQINGPIMNDNTSTRYRFTVEDSFIRGAASGCSSWGNGAVGVAEYTARRVRISGFPDGFRVAGSNILIEDSHVTLCSANVNDHSDGIQVYGASNSTNITIRHNTIDQRPVTNGAATAPIFAPVDGAQQGNSGVTLSIVDNLVAGGGYSIRAFGTLPMTVLAFTGNKVVNNTWAYGPLDVTCSKIQSFSGNAVVTFDFTTGSILSQVRTLNDCP